MELDPPLDLIRVRGARTHNLHSLSLDLPRGGLIVFTGPSGSGKSSLAFDTIFAEGQRRFLATLPDVPRDLAPRRPDVDAVDGLPPVLAVAQISGAPRPRSTLATLTEIHDHLRLLWARRGTPFCPDCELPIHQHSLAEIARHVLMLPPGRKLFLLAPLVHETPGLHKDVFARIRQGGFLRARIDGVLFEIRDNPAIDAAKPHTIDLVVDRLVVRPGMEDRLHESLGSAARLGDGRVIISDVEETGDWNDATFSTRLACTQCRRVIADLEPRRFHFNHPQGACPTCTGLGLIASKGETEPQQTAKVSPDDDLEEENLIPCPECGGARLNRDMRAVRYADLRLTDVTAMTVAAAHQAFAEHLQNAARDALTKIESILLREIVSRLHFLKEVGLGYLTLDRPAPTLSGGELQRARLATQLGGGLRGVCYVLDEPTLGLHPHDTQRLLGALRALQARGNTLLVIEHDEAVMRCADYLVDLGPGAGKEGGQLLAAGTYAEVAANPRSVTGPFLQGSSRIDQSTDGLRARANPQSLSPRDLGLDDPHGADRAKLIIHGVRHHNLKNIDAAFPLGCFVVVTGVSGSGKSSLVRDVLAPVVRRHLHLRTAPPGVHDTVAGLDHVDKLIEVDQRPLGRSSRSSAATYTGLFDEIRKLFARTRTAKIRGYKPNRFSFNVRGGRCEACQGQGETHPGGPFLPELTVPCHACQGSRYNPATLEVRFKGQSIADVLALDVRTARSLFSAVPPIERILAALEEVGLGYLTLGQPSSRLSGGEAQRVKLAAELARTATGRTIFLLDEPTAGLHRIDVARLVNVLRGLVDAGNTVIVIEHHLDVIAAGDWVIDLGPDAGDRGGAIVAEGPPDAIAACPQSVTGQFLAKQS